MYMTNKVVLSSAKPGLYRSPAAHLVHKHLAEVKLPVAAVAVPTTAVAWHRT